MAKGWQGDLQLSFSPALAVLVSQGDYAANSQHLASHLEGLWECSVDETLWTNRHWLASLSRARVVGHLMALVSDQATLAGTPATDSDSGRLRQQS